MPSFVIHACDRCGRVTSSGPLALNASTARLLANLPNVIGSPQCCMPCGVALGFFAAPTPVELECEERSETSWRSVVAAHDKSDETRAAKGCGAATLEAVQAAIGRAGGG